MEASAVRIHHPNREKPQSKATKAAVTLLLVASAALIALVTIGGYEQLAGATIVAVAYVIIYLVMAYFVVRWSRGVLPMAAGLAIIFTTFAAVAAPAWFARDEDGFTDPLLPAGLLGLLVLVVIAVQLLLILFAMRGFQQEWNIEVEVREGEDEHHDGSEEAAGYAEEGTATREPLQDYSDEGTPAEEEPQEYADEGTPEHGAQQGHAAQPPEQDSSEGSAEPGTRADQSEGYAEEAAHEPEPSQEYAEEGTREQEPAEPFAEEPTREEPSQESEPGTREVLPLSEAMAHAKAVLDEGRPSQDHEQEPAPEQAHSQDYAEESTREQNVPSDQPDKGAGEQEKP